MCVCVLFLSSYYAFEENASQVCWTTHCSSQDALRMGTSHLKEMLSLSVFSTAVGTFV